MTMWQPIETAPKDQFLLLCGPSEYTITPMVVTTGCMYSDYHAGRWIDHANDDLADWGFKPTHWAPLTLPGAQPAQSVPDGWLQHAARMATLAKKLREPDWCLESIREMQRELRTLEEAALAGAKGE